MKAVVSAQKDLQGSETKTRELGEGRKEKKNNPDEGSWGIYPPGISVIICTKSQQNIIELVARPVISTRTFLSCEL